MPSQIHYIGRLWQEETHTTTNNNRIMQQQQPADETIIRLRTRKVSIDNSLRATRYPIYTKSFSFPRFQLQFDVAMRTCISRILTYAQVPLCHQEEFIQYFCAFARSISRSQDQILMVPLINVSIMILTVNWQPGGESHDQSITRGARESMEIVKPVPASKSCIEGLEKVRLHGSMARCVICLEEFWVGLEVTRMPCSLVYHGHCIVRWLGTSHFCPLCRCPMPFN